MTYFLRRTNVFAVVPQIAVKLVVAVEAEDPVVPLFDDYLVVGTKPPAPGTGPAQLL